MYVGTGHTYVCTHSLCGLGSRAASRPCCRLSLPLSSQKGIWEVASFPSKVCLYGSGHGMWGMDTCSGQMTEARSLDFSSRCPEH